MSRGWALPGRVKVLTPAQSPIKTDQTLHPQVCCSNPVNCSSCMITHSGEITVTYDTTSLAHTNVSCTDSLRHCDNSDVDKISANASQARAFNNSQVDAFRAKTVHSQHDDAHPAYSNMHASPANHKYISTDILQNIPTPQVDHELVKRQAVIYKDTWPELTDAARCKHPRFALLYDQVKHQNLPNFLGARQTVSSGLNLRQWENQLAHYHDKEICWFLRYGWPVGYHLDTPPTSVGSNHQSAEQHGTHIDNFISIELEQLAIVGPFEAKPFKPWTRLSPLMTRPKRGSDSRRVIVDMSFPAGEAVNDGINITSIYGRDTTYTLPSIKDLVTLIQQANGTAWLWKADFARAYRQLRVDPIDTPLLGFGVSSGIYLDQCPSFGCRSSSAACQRVSAAVVFLMARAGFKVLAFLDDFAGCEISQQRAQLAYNTFLQLTRSLGLKLATEKCQEPTSTMQWLGYDIDTSLMSVSIPQDRLRQVLGECTLWLAKTRASRSMIQSLVGRLIHLANCVRHARKFTARILSTLRHMISSDQTWTTIDEGFKADVNWFRAYAEASNGISLISPIKANIYIECDSSLEGGGGNSDSFFYKWKYSPDHKLKYKDIHQLEAINLLVSYRTLCPANGTAGCRVVLVTDNLASSFALMSGRTKDSTLGACARELWLEAAKADHELEIIHKEGAKIPLADALSRYHSDPSKASFARGLINDRNLTELPPKLLGYTFFTKI